MKRGKRRTKGKPARKSPTGRKPTDLKAALRAAIQHHQAGRLQQAEQIYRRVLEVQPNNADALQLLGLMAHQVGRHETAIRLIGKAIQVNPSHAALHNNLGEAQRALGRFSDAIASYRRALAIKPDYAEAHNNLGIVLAEQGDLDDAVASYRRAQALKPDYAEAHNNLGTALRRQGNSEDAIASYHRALAIKPDYAEAHSNLGVTLAEQGDFDDASASYRRALAIKPDYAGVHNNLGTALAEQGKPDQAIASFQRALAVKPDYAEAHNNLGNALRHRGRPDQAIASYRRALEINPDYAEAHNSLGIALQDQGRPDQAIASHRRALELDPDYASAHNNLGIALLGQGRLDQAVASYRRALEIDPDYASAHNNLGIALQDQGRLDQAIASYRRALELDPDHVAAHYNHATLHKHGPGDPAIEKLKQLLKPEDLPEDDRNQLLFALGKGHDDLGLYAEAFSYYRRANEEKAKRANFDAVRLAKQTVAIKKVFRQRLGPAGEYSQPGRPVPIFVVGMSRSGKTLVESLLSQHDDVHGAGERYEWARAVEKVVAKYSISESFPEFAHSLGIERLREIGKTYLEDVSKHLPDCRFFVDTMPGNGFFIALILQAIPFARIICCRRDPLDNCLSIYFKRYRSHHEYSYDLASLASYYANYHEVMAHWLKLYGERILEVRYEDLVRDPGRTGARIYRFCGLEYEPTAIRQAFTRDEIGRWKHYERYLGALIRALRDQPSEARDRGSRISARAITSDPDA